MLRKLVCLFTATVFWAGLGGGLGAEEKFPARPIRMVLSSAAGGGTDLWGRTVCSIMEKELGTKITTNNMIGAGGATATLYAWNAPHDGHTWVSANDSTPSFPVMTGAKETLADSWVFFIAGGSPGLLCASAKSGLKTPEDLLKTARNTPGKLKITYAAGSVWANQSSVLTGTCKLGVTHVPIAGTRPAIVATVAGETDLVVASVGEMIDFIQNGDLVPILMTGSEPYTLDGREIKAVTEFLPAYADFTDLKQWQGVMLPKDTPAAAATAISGAFAKAMTSPEMAEFVTRNHAVLYNLQGEDALKFAKNNERLVSWVLHDLGLDQHSPESMGIEK